MAHSTGASSTHLWVCDNYGKVYIIQDIDATIESIHSKHAIPQDPKVAPAADFNCKMVDGSLDKVAGGFSGLICGIRGTVFYVRRGVTHDNPLGSSWAKCFVDAVDIAIGSQCAVRKTSQGKLFVTKIDEHIITPPIFQPIWNVVPPCGFVDNFQHFVLDARDNLYIVASSGEVYGCFDIRDNIESATWRLASKPPFETKSGFSLLSFWRSKKSNGELFSHVCAGSNATTGSHTLWCVRKDSNEIWQLVLSEFIDSSGGMELKSNWVRFCLPKDDKLSCLSADKLETKIDTLYAITNEGKRLVTYSLLQENSGKLELPNPERLTDRLWWKSIAVCRTQLKPVNIQSIKLSTQAKQISSIYPKLPKLEDFDLCCETGDCEFCRSAAARESLPGPSRKEFIPPKPKRPRLESPGGLLSSPYGSSSGHKGRKHPRESSVSEEEQFYTTLAFQPKRPRPHHPHLARYFFLDGIKLSVKDYRPPKVRPSFILLKYTLRWAS